MELIKQRRDLIVYGLNAIPGISCRKPHGLFYAFPNIKSFGKSSKEISDYLLEEVGVATLTGTAFGSYGERYLRISFANSVENIQEALDCMASALQKL